MVEGGRQYRRSCAGSLRQRGHHCRGLGLAHRQRCLSCECSKDLAGRTTLACPGGGAGEGNDSSEGLLRCSCDVHKEIKGRRVMVRAGGRKTT